MEPAHAIRAAAAAGARKPARVNVHEAGKSAFFRLALYAADRICVPRLRQQRAD